MFAAMKSFVLLALATTTCSADVSTPNFLKGHRELQSCDEVCSGQGSCATGQIIVCHEGEEDECIAMSEWMEHCTDFGDTCGACPTSTPAGACFSADATLFVQGKGVVTMKDAQVGDMVQTSEDGTFEPLYAFGHLEKERAASFVKISTNSDSLEVTACLLYTSPSPRDQRGSRMPSSA